MLLHRPLVTLARLQTLLGPASGPTIGRTLSSVSGRRAKRNVVPKVPPESPLWTPLKTLPFAEESDKPRRRGFLPVPREPWLRHEGTRRISQAYIDETAPRPKPENRRPPPQRGSRGAWKLNMADQRRRSLRSGLLALWHRRAITKKGNRRTSLKRRRRNDLELRAATLAMENDRLTTPTVPILDTKVYPDPNRFQLAQAKRSHYLHREEARREERRAAILNLYHRAGSFIVTESELKKHVESIFTDKHFSRQGSSNLELKNVWQLYGPPPAITDMRGWGSGDIRDGHNGARMQTLNQHRLWALGQEMTGGQRAT